MTNKAAEVVAVLFKIAGKPGEEFRMAGRVGGIHEIDWVDETASEHESPDAIDDGAGEIGVVGGERLGKSFASREFGDGEMGEIFFEFLVFLEFSEPLLGRGDGIEFR